MCYTTIRIISCQNQDTNLAYEVVNEIRLIVDCLIVGLIISFTYFINYTNIYIQYKEAYYIVCLFVGV